MKAWIAPIEGEPFRFMVKSRKIGVPDYLVDLEERKWNGECGCPDFQFNRIHWLNEGWTHCEKTRCWHIRRARDFVLDRLLQETKRHMEKTK